MITFVLVHGAWQTAATWDLVSPLLLSAGHRVFVPGLSGLENDGVPLSAEVTLDTHIQDVCRFLEERNLFNVVLVGHSYAGMVITGVAARVAERLSQLIYVDAFVPASGGSALQFLQATLQSWLRVQASAEPGGFLLKPTQRQLDLWGLKNGPARQFVEARMSNFSLICFDSPVVLSSPISNHLSRAYIANVADDYPAKGIFAPFAHLAKRCGWPYIEMHTGHDGHAEEPERFCSALIELATLGTVSGVSFDQGHEASGD